MMTTDSSDRSGLPSDSGAETGSLRDICNVILTKDQFWVFLERHAPQMYLIPEDNDIMKDSYLNLDE